MEVEREHSSGSECLMADFFIYQFARIWKADVLEFTEFSLSQKILLSSFIECDIFQPSRRDFVTIWKNVTHTCDLLDNKAINVIKILQL